jgi:hypothetical protein
MYHGFGPDHQPGRMGWIFVHRIAINWQRIQTYVATADGLYQYQTMENSRDPGLSEDIRTMTGRQPFLKNAPVNFI